MSTKAPLASLPPSALLAYRELECEGPLEQPELCERTRLKSRTARYALERLKESGFVEVERVAGDARRKRYSLSNRATESGR